MDGTMRFLSSSIRLSSYRMTCRSKRCRQRFLVDTTGRRQQLPSWNLGTTMCHSITTSASSVATTGTSDTTSSSSSSSSNGTITVFWCSRVVFGKNAYNNNTASRSHYPVQQGCVVVNHLGIIESCFPGCSRDDAYSMAQTLTPIVKGHNNSNNETRYEFIDLTQTPSSVSCRDGLCLSPGLIDVHTHISSLGRDWEGYTTATAAAAAGGITSIIGMPLNSLPPTVSVDDVERELSFATNPHSSKLHIDVGLWGGVLPETAGDEQHLRNLLSHPNVLGLKAFLSPLPDGAGYQAITPTQLLDVAKLCGTFRKPILVHSELMSVEEQHAAINDAYPDDGSLDNSHRAHVASRPTKWEQDAVQVVIEASQYCDMHVVHLSDGIGCLPLIQEVRKRKKTTTENRQIQHLCKDLTVETCPHYLLFDTDQISSSTGGNDDDDRRVKCFPPIREPDQRRRLWRGLVDGDINMIASDHSPCHPSMRHGDDNSSMKTAWGGLSGLQYQLAATWTASKLVMEEENTNAKSLRRERIHSTITEQDMAEWWSVAPAKLAGLDVDRGCIEAGKRADFVLWDTSYVGSPNEYCQEYHRWKGDCVYSTKHDLCGRVVGTWLKGVHIYDGWKDEILRDDQGRYIESVAIQLQ